jgi:hypothetical protein
LHGILSGACRKLGFPELFWIFQREGLLKYVGIPYAGVPITILGEIL